MGSAESVLSLPSAAWLDVQWLEEPVPSEALVEGMPTHNDAHIESTASTAALMIQRIEDGGPRFEILLLSLDGSLYGCLQAPCGRRESDVLVRARSEDVSETGAYGQRTIKLVPGRYVVAILAPDRAFTSARIDLDFDDGRARESGRVELADETDGDLRTTEMSSALASVSGEGALTGHLVAHGDGIGGWAVFDRAEAGVSIPPQRDHFRVCLESRERKACWRKETPSVYASGQGFVDWRISDETAGRIQLTWSERMLRLTPRTLGWLVTWPTVLPEGV